jgi:hypothetical protein
MDSLMTDCCLLIRRDNTIAARLVPVDARNWRNHHPAWLALLPSELSFTSLQELRAYAKLHSLRVERKLSFFGTQEKVIG